MSRLGRSGIREIMDLAASLEGVVHLELGEPDFPTPPHIVEAVQRAMAGGQIKYTQSRGDRDLRELIADKLVRVTGVAATPETVAVTSGGTAAVFGALSAIVRPGDGVLIPDPGWPAFEMITQLVGSDARRYRLLASNGFEPDLDEVDQLAQGARAIVINTPSNPSGAVFSKQTVEGLLELAVRHDLLVVSDEVYEQIVFDGSHVSATALDPDGRVIGVYSFSKGYAMTGWRVGYLSASPAIIDAVVRVQEAAAACPSWPGQQAALAALAGPQEAVASMVNEYRQRRDVAVALLESAGRLAGRPHGTFYVLARIGSDETDTYDFAYRLLREERVAVAPGETFGPAGAGLIRLSLASSSEAIAAGVNAVTRLAPALSQRMEASDG